MVWVAFRLSNLISLSLISNVTPKNAFDAVASAGVDPPGKTGLKFILGLLVSRLLNAVLPVGDKVLVTPLRDWLLTPASIH